MGSALYLSHFCTVLDRELRHVPEICWSHSQPLMLLLPLGPLWTSPFHLCCHCCFRPYCFFIFACFFLQLLSPRIATSAASFLPCSLSTTTVWLVSQQMLLSRELEVSQDLHSVVVYLVQWWVPSGLLVFQHMFATGVTVHIPDIQ